MTLRMTPESKTQLVRHSGNKYNINSVAFSEWKILKHSQEDVTGNTCFFYFGSFKDIGMQFNRRLYRLIATVTGLV